MAASMENQNSCLRWQFFEAITRVAQMKYLQSGICATIAEAVETLLNKHYFPQNGWKEWHDWRMKTWWCWETHDVLHANTKNLNKIYKSFFAPRKKFMTKQDCIFLMTKASVPPVL